jgi:hypothetical protein
MNVVVDTNVVISAIFWPGESRRCLALWAKRRFHLALTVPVLKALGVGPYSPPRGFVTPLLVQERENPEL